MTGHVEVEVLVLVLATATIAELLTNGIPQTVWYIGDCIKKNISAKVFPRLEQPLTLTLR